MFGVISGGKIIFPKSAKKVLEKKWIVFSLHFLDNRGGRGVSDLSVKNINYYIKFVLAFCYSKLYIISVGCWQTTNNCVYFKIRTLKERKISRIATIAFPPKRFIIERSMKSTAHIYLAYEEWRNMSIKTTFYDE